MNIHGDTIAAISTPPGKGGVALIRISGDRAIEIADKVFKPRYTASLTEARCRYTHYGDILSDGKVIDDGIAVVYPAPHSYTGESMAEIYCHGGVLLSRQVLTSVLSMGAVAAEAGEFTKRAFINGKITLTEAEGVGLLLEASSEAQLRLSARGSLSCIAPEIVDIRKKLVHLLASIYASIDYPEEDLSDIDDTEVIAALTGAAERIEALIATYRTGHAIAEGIPTVICGLPNVGKSSLYNALCGAEDAIVTEQAGTTRDILRSTVTVGDVTLRLADTAGIRAASDRVEQIGVDRAVAEVENAELILAVFDGAAMLTESDKALIDKIKGCSGAAIAVVNKCDKPIVCDIDRHRDAFDRVVKVSAATGDIAELQGAVTELFLSDRLTPGEDMIVSSARQAALLNKALGSITEAIGAFGSGISRDAASTDIEQAVRELGEIDGREVSEEVVADIFAGFCVGK